MIKALEPLSELYLRELDKLEAEIDSYESEEQLWTLAGEINNTAGNLCLHLCGNLQHFFGHMMGESDYVRRRDDEFGLKDIPRAQLKDEIEKSRKAVLLGLESISRDQLDVAFPVEVLGHPMTYRFFIHHLQGHLNYHLGQINYHRRILISG